MLPRFVRVTGVIKIALEVQTAHFHLTLFVSSLLYWSANRKPSAQECWHQLVHERAGGCHHYRRVVPADIFRANSSTNQRELSRRTDVFKEFSHNLFKGKTGGRDEEVLNQ